jgi:hypothetical protein
MPQIFHRSTNTLSRLSIFGALFVLAGLLWALAAINRSAYMTGQGVARVQPVQFSHKHHAGELGIDCRYCHTQVETAAYAGIPPTQTCMNCHAQIWADSPFLAPVRASKVYVLPDYVYFDHSIHVQKGVGCATCHGRIDRMNQVYRAASLQMEWCLDCHRRPERYLRPRAHVFDLAWRPHTNQEVLGRRLVAAYHVRPRTDCSACHR